MIDLNKDIYDMLKNICKVESQFPTSPSTFPLITITEVTNGTNYIVDGVELISDITYQIDVWDNGKDRRNVEALAKQASDILIANFFVRTLSRNTTENGIHRKMMYFTTKVIN